MNDQPSPTDLSKLAAESLVISRTTMFEDSKACLSGATDTRQRQ